MLHDDTTITATAAFVKAPVQQRSTLARDLGSELYPDDYVITDHSGATSHPLVWAAGNVRRPAPAPHQVVLAAVTTRSTSTGVHQAGGLPLLVRAHVVLSPRRHEEDPMSPGVAGSQTWAGG